MKSSTFKFSKRQNKLKAEFFANFSAKSSHTNSILFFIRYLWDSCFRQNVRGRFLSIWWFQRIIEAARSVRERFRERGKDNLILAKAACFSIRCSVRAHRFRWQQPRTCLRGCICTHRVFCLLCQHACLAYIVPVV